MSQYQGRIVGTPFKMDDRLPSDFDTFCKLLLSNALALAIFSDPSFHFQPSFGVRSRMLKEKLNTRSCTANEIENPAASAMA